MESEYLNSVEFSAQPLDIDFHPHKNNLLVSGLVDGTIEVHDLRKEENGENDDADDEADSILSSIPVHSKLVKMRKKDNAQPESCRAVAFSTDGKSLYTGGSSGDFCSVDAEIACSFSTTPRKSILWRTERATEEISNPLLVIQPFQNSALVATGDDSGGVQIWDPRIMGRSSSTSRTESPSKPPGCVLSWRKNEDYISAIEHSKDEESLLATSADGKLSVFDLRMARDPSKKGQATCRLSDDQGDELLSMKIIKNGKKVVCGTQEGVLSIFSWGVWGDCSDRFPGHPQSICALQKVDEDTLLTGSSDGWIRLVQVQPDKLLGLLGENHDGFPIEKLGFNSDRSILGSLTHSNTVRLWDARVLQDDDGSDGDDDSRDQQEGNEEDPVVEAKPASGRAWGTSHKKEEDDWSNSDAEDSSDDDSDDSGGEPLVSINDKRKKRLKTSNEKFFEDL